MPDAAQDPLFPPVEKAQPDGLLMVGGKLAPAWLLAAYSQGIFPWPVVQEDQEILAWFSPDPRAVVELDRFHIPRRLARRIRSGEFQVSVNRDFAAVVAACAEPRATDQGTWITSRMIQAYRRLHALGYAHSVEIWHDGNLVGGLYGVALGGFFAGESMFHRRRDASKVALAHLVRRLQQRGFTLFDVQQSSPHLTRLGATEIPRSVFLRRLRVAIASTSKFTDLWDPQSMTVPFA